MSESFSEEEVPQVSEPTEPQLDPVPEPEPDFLPNFPPFGENVFDGNNQAVYMWDFPNRKLIRYHEDGTSVERPMTSEEIELIPAVEEQNGVESARETARQAIKAIVADLQAEKARVQVVIDKSNSAITGGDTKDVARAAKRIADAAIELARFVQNI